MLPGNFEDKNVVWALVLLLDDDELKVREAAFAALKDVKETYDYKPDLPTAERKAAVAKWKSLVREGRRVAGRKALGEPMTILSGIALLLLAQGGVSKGDQEIKHPWHGDFKDDYKDPKTKALIMHYRMRAPEKLPEKKRSASSSRSTA